MSPEKLLILYPPLAKHIDHNDYEIIKLEGAWWGNIFWNPTSRLFFVDNRYIVHLNGDIEQKNFSTTNSSITNSRKTDLYRYRGVGEVNLESHLFQYKYNFEKLRDEFTKMYYSATVFAYSKDYVALKIDDIWYRAIRSDSKYWFKKAIFGDFLKSHEEKYEFPLIRLNGVYYNADTEFFNYPSYNWSKKSNILRLEKFKSSFYGADIAYTEIPTKIYGTGYYALNFKNQKIRFSAFASKAVFSINKSKSYMQLYLPPKHIINQANVFFINYKSVIANEPYSEQIGIYLVRSKINIPKDTSLPFVKVTNNKGTFSPYDQIKEQISYDINLLSRLFNKAMTEKNAIADFIAGSKAIAKTSSIIEEYKYEMADYTTKLLINRLKQSDYKLAKEVYYNYIKNLLPYAKKHNKTSDVSSNALVLSIESNDADISHSVFEHLLGNDFDIMSIDNDILAFNLACYYALKKEKKELLNSIKHALKLGKKPEQFKNDANFKAYLKDADFLQLLNTGQ